MTLGKLIDYFIDFSYSTTLNDQEKEDIINIQQNYRPMERVDFLMAYKIQGKITDDEFEKMTGVPYVG